MEGWQNNLADDSGVSLWLPDHEFAGLPAPLVQQEGLSINSLTWSPDANSTRQLVLPAQDCNSLNNWFLSSVCYPSKAFKWLF